MTPLLPWRPASLSPSVILRLCGHVDADQLVHARGQLVVVVAVEDADADDGAGLAVRNLQGGVAHFAGLLTEDGAQQALFRGQLGLALRGDLADQDVAGFNLGTDVDDAALVQAGQDFLGHVRDVTGDFLGTKLGVAGIDLVLLDVDRGEHVLGDDALGEDDGILEVVAFPGHERHQQVLAQGELALVRCRAVGDDAADFQALAFVDQDALVVAVALVGAGELVDRGSWFPCRRR